MYIVRFYEKTAEIEVDEMKEVNKILRRIERQNKKDPLNKQSQIATAEKIDREAEKTTSYVSKAKERKGNENTVLHIFSKMCVLGKFTEEEANEEIRKIQEQDIKKRLVIIKKEV